MNRAVRNDLHNSNDRFPAFQDRNHPGGARGSPNGHLRQSMEPDRFRDNRLTLQRGRTPNKKNIWGRGMQEDYCDREVGTVHNNPSQVSGWLYRPKETEISKVNKILSGEQLRNTGNHFNGRSSPAGTRQSTLKNSGIPASMHPVLIDPSTNPMRRNRRPGSLYASQVNELGEEEDGDELLESEIIEEKPLEIFDNVKSIYAYNKKIERGGEDPKDLNGFIQIERENKVVKPKMRKVKPGVEIIELKADKSLLLDDGESFNQVRRPRKRRRSRSKGGRKKSRFEENNNATGGVERYCRLLGEKQMKKKKEREERESQFESDTIEESAMCVLI